MSLLNISCKKATFLISKKEQKRISLFDRITLQIHLGICTLCKRFEQQTGFIIKNAKHTHEEEKLSEEVKEKIIENISKL